MNVNLTFTKDYRKNDCLAAQKTNPIQTQFKPNQTQSNPISEKSEKFQKIFAFLSNI